jgi:hypothetical protein
MERAHTHTEYTSSGKGGGYGVVGEHFSGKSFIVVVRSRDLRYSTCTLASASQPQAHRRIVEDGMRRRRCLSSVYTGCLRTPYTTLLSLQASEESIDGASVVKDDAMMGRPK